MGRRNRADLVHPFLHVYTRGADQQDIFSSYHDRLVMEQLLASFVDDHAVAIHAYCLMSNHIHLLVDRAHGDISAAMRQLLGCYGRYYNVEHDRTGPVFTGRFNAVEVKTDAQALQLSRYIHLNPLKFTPHSAITRYRWSSLPVYAGSRPAPDWLTTGFVDRIHHRSAGQYVSYVLERQPTDEADGRPRRAWSIAELEDVDRAAAHVTDVEPDAVIDGASKRARLARLAAITVAVGMRVASPADLRDHYGFTSPSGARNAARRGRVRASDDPGFDELLGRIRGHIDALLGRPGDSSHGSTLV